MSLFLNTNISALKARYQVDKSTARLDSSYEKLSSGLKINSAKDDPAGLQTSDRLTVQINSLNQTNRNAQNAIAYAQTAEGAIQEITTMLQRIRTLSLQSANGTNTELDRNAIQLEVDALNEEIGRIARDTTFGGQDLLNGNASIVRFQISPDPGSIIKIDLTTGFDTDNLAKMAAFVSGRDDFELPEGHTYSAGTTFKFEDIFKYQVNGGGIDVSTQSAAQLVLAGIDYLITAVDTKRSELGAIQNRLESTIRNQENVAENVSDSRALIRDADYAEEVSVMTSSQILQQGSITILTQANQKSQVALQMLQDSY
ncbi:MAG: flagellin [Succinivibrio sp.]|jgi:flagellin|uniref:flagellin N-terminal helical domain-containing protein n=1 Tax=Succinivibrio sp. TaxID=2053619 RepID=UPI0025D46B78|nr:flagellin [Succinivibrio sp.]MBQ4246607.1 flagellin [Succinivibrio sp.]MBQ9221079.1 flagellin [Succinivibrio sp.]MBR1613059.1 flagellin [Succinivibrio sp.]